MLENARVGEVILAVSMAIAANAGAATVQQVVERPIVNVSADLQALKPDEIEGANRTQSNGQPFKRTV